MSKLLEKAEERADQILEEIKKLLKGKSGGKSGVSDDRLIEKLKSLESAYNDAGKIPSPDYSKTIPETLGLTPKEFTPESDAELKARAEAELLPDYIKKTESEKLGSEYKLDKLAAEEKSLLDKEKSEEEGLEAELSELLRRQRAQVIRQGIVHSSINAEGQKEIARYGQEQTARISSGYDAKITALKTEIDYVTAAYQDALRGYELKYAADLEKKIATLKLQQEKRLEEINKYNLEIEKKEREYQKKREAEIAEEEKKRRKLEELLNKASAISESAYGEPPDKKAEYDKRYETALGFYSELDKETAERLMGQNAEELARLLGEERFISLYNKIRNRQVK